jgi:general secretion pathway protein C
MSGFALNADTVQAQAPRIVTALLGVAIAVQLGFLVTDYMAGVRAPTPATMTAVANSNRPPLDLVSLMNAHLFGQAANTLDSRNAPTTSAALVLAGTIAGEDPQRGFALIGESAAAARVYATGAALPGGVKLHEVYRDRVIIDRGGALESLLLPRQALSLGAPPPPQAANTALNSLQQTLARNPDAFSDVVRVQVVTVGAGKARGVRVFPGSNSAAFSRLGLRPGDLVTSINGTPLDDPSRAEEIFSTMQSMPEARVGVVRNGRPTEISVNMTDVTRQADELLGTEGMTPASAMPPPQE